MLPENVFSVCVRINLIRLILSLKFCILQYIDIFCIRQILHPMRGWLGIEMTYLEMNPEFLENICKWYVSSISQFKMIEIICLSSSWVFSQAVVLCHWTRIDIKRNASPFLCLYTYNDTITNKIGIWWWHFINTLSTLNVSSISNLNASLRFCVFLSILQFSFFASIINDIRVGLVT